MFFFLNIQATPVSEETAKQAALNFLAHYSKLKTGLIAFSDSKQTTYNGITTYYTFSLQNGGWIIISADDAATPVLAYSTSGVLDPDNLNPTAQLWLKIYNKEIFQAAKESSKTSSPEWDLLLNQNFTDGLKTVEPLIKTKWNQSRYYNDLCPASASAPYGYGGHVPTGCVATTMAQIMKYHEYPQQGIGANTYIHPSYGTLSASYGSTDYNWGSMPVSATTVNSAIATLMYHCGVAVEMDYNPEASGAQSESVPYALQKFFNYDNTIELYRREDVGNDEIWRTLIRTELDNSRPVYYAGSGSGGGHAFVCDGYDGSNPTKFHFNWGWGGSENGYFAIGALNTSTAPFNDFNRIITGIKPRKNSEFIYRIEFAAHNDTIAPGTNVSLTAKAIKGVASKVILYVDGLKTDSLETAPFNFTVSTNKFAAGPHQIAIEASNATGKNYHSEQIIIKTGCWQLQPVPFSVDSVNIEQISAVDANVVWATLGDFSSKDRTLRKYIKTTNGGTTWSESTISCPTCTSLEISNIHAISATKAYACLNPGNATGGAILMTDNGGTSWTTQTTADFTGGWANWVYFFDENNGVCMGDPAANRFFVFTTSNGGTTWTRVSTTNIPNAVATEAGTVNFFDAVGSTIWFGTSTGRIYKSTDKGITWTVKAGVLGNVQTNVNFRDANTGFAFGGYSTSDYGFKKTTDGGATWTDAKPLGDISGQDYEFIPGTDSTWINSGYYSSISATDNRSYYWLDVLNTIRTTKFLSPNIGWGGGNYSIKGGGGMYKWVGSLAPSYNENIVLRVRDKANNPIPDANAEFNFQKKITNSEGLAAFSTRGFGNPEYYKVSKTGFSTSASTYNVTVADTIKIILNPSYSITFNVVNKSDVPISGATVLFNDANQITDNNGNVTFTNINIGKSYPYAITKLKYFAGYGTLSITNKDSTVNVKLVTDATATPKEKKLTSVIFPNPASDQLNILSQKPISEVEIFSLTGKLVWSKTYQYLLLILNRGNI